MAVKTLEELLTGIREILPDDTSDEAIGLLEDVSDSFNEAAKNEENENWKKRYEDNDREWRQKYRDRFFNTGSNDKDKQQAEEPEEKPVKKSFADLFEVKE